LIAAWPAAAAEQRVLATQDLQQAVALAKPGDTLRLAPGRYQGPLVITVPGLRVIGEPGAIIDGGGLSSVVQLRASNVTLQGLHLTNGERGSFSTSAGVFMSGVQHCTVRDCTIDTVFWGIKLENAPHNRIIGNTVSGAAPTKTFSQWGDGIRVWQSPETTVTGNTFHDFRDGIYLEFSNRSLVEDNHVYGNRRYGLHFMYMDGSGFRHNRFERNQTGCVLMYSQRLTVTGNTFANSLGAIGQGVLFKENDDGVLQGNRIINNTVGMFLDGSDHNRITGNLIAGNGWGMLLFASSANNTFSGNNFIGNGFDLASDMRRTRNRFTGNYWSRYRGYDLDGDGYGDEPFAPVSIFAFLTMQYPDLYAFSGSPAMQALDFVQRRLPALSPSALRDDRPRMRPIVAPP
jgi:nitrous oxidase accessory protein